MRGPELTPVLTAQPVEWIVRCVRDGRFCGYVRVLPGPATDRWYAGDLESRRMKFGQCESCGRTYRVRKG